MKSDIHPKYGPAKVICACGEVWDIKSTRPEIHVG
ncbi:MAG: 50S ribosomal protein L31, partial [Lentisphaeria bacterium]|nr:50S ribosomal protein L31 [Lentisphaeria bacterium]